jgi:hypothetical protein
MGKFVRITDANDGSVVALSMIKWGVLRRGAVSVLPVQRPTHFIPRHEIAVFNGPHAGLKPHVVFFYCDEEAALKGWGELVKIIEGFGLIGVDTIYCGTGDPRKEAFLRP